VFTARYGLIPYLKEITFRLLRVKQFLIWFNLISLKSQVTRNRELTLIVALRLF